MCKAVGRPAAVWPAEPGLFLLRVGARGRTLSTSGIGLQDGELMISRQVFLVCLICAVFLLIVGLSGLFWPEKIQTYALEHSTSHLHQKVNPFSAWMKTRQYIWALRVIGMMSLGSAVLLLVILAKLSE